MTHSTELRCGSSQEPPLQASKWLQLQVLADSQEMERLFDAFGNFLIFKAGVLCNAGEGEISKEEFLRLYSNYVDALKLGQLPDDALYRQSFSSVFTTDPGNLFQVEVAGNRRIIRVARPVLQLQMHKMSYSSVDGKFRPMVLGKDCIFWGLQFSYPQLFQDESKEVYKALEEEQFPDSKLYRILQKWLRQETIPTPFIVDTHQINVPIRLGKNCVEWINRHPQL
nr:hypothetical protein [Parachlamydiaceae bacterium]